MKAAAALAAEPPPLPEPDACSCRLQLSWTDQRFYAERRSGVTTGDGALRLLVFIKESAAAAPPVLPPACQPSFSRSACVCPGGNSQAQPVSHAQRADKERLLRSSTRTDMQTSWCDLPLRRLWSAQSGSGVSWPDLPLLCSCDILDSLTALRDLRLRLPVCLCVCVDKCANRRQTQT